MTTATDKLTVQLPVCPIEDCRRVGKIPVGHYGGTEYCSGPIGNSHKRVRMKKRTFEMVDASEAVPPSRPSNHRDTRPTSNRKEAGR